ncbi:olfactory receptor 52E4-like [Pelobates fuscus]|uniref:olfactory receptor 52E4-like n=1 Tax=Pelobates fuscus TaxID=191477 RepID=UPI002FE491F0
MENSTYFHPSVLMLSFGDLTSLRYLFSALTLIGYFIIIFVNGTVISAVVLNKTLHEPMYIFIAALCVNGLYGSIAFYPILFVHLVYNVQTISYTGCLTQVFFLHTYGSFEMTTLTIMAYDRYVCICNPLRYNNIMSLATVFKLIVAAWLYPIVIVGLHVMLTARLPMCGSLIMKVYCDNWSVVRLSCVDTTVNNIYGFFIASSLVVSALVMLSYSYTKILKVCTRSSKDILNKAMQTCGPQLITSVNFIVDIFFEIFLYRFTPTIIPYNVRQFMSMQFLVVPPLLNPLIYGIKITEMRVKIIKMFNMNKIYNK